MLTRRRSRLSFLLFVVWLALFAGGLVQFLRTEQPTPLDVTELAVGAFLSLVFGIGCFFSVFSTVSVIGVVLGVAALTLVLSVTSGFQAAIQEKVLGVNAHVLVMRAGFTNYRDVEELARGLKPDVIAVQPFVFSEMLITRGKGELSGILLKGVDPDRLGSVLDLPQHMREGSVAALKQHPPGAPPPVILGKELAHKLRAGMGDVVTLVLPNVAGDIKNLAAQPPRQRKFVVGGIFYSGFAEYDGKLVYVSIADAQDFLGQGDTVNGVEMKVRDVWRAPVVARKLEKLLGPEQYMVMDWRELNNNLFTALSLQKSVLVLFLALIIVVAAFNMVAALTMMVLDKTKEIAILKSMGAPSRGVAGLFQVVGLSIGAVGTVAGIALGLLFGHGLSRYGYKLDPKVYLIDRLPVSVNPWEVALVAGLTLAICFLATLVPALSAAGLRPVEGLRYE
ncbi:MAG TPA: ABC transporter permease [Haliangiales bacterium]|nr:ABC transporter permease [Haliangiales bacterium]